MNRVPSWPCSHRLALVTTAARSTHVGLNCEKNSRSRSRSRIIYYNTSYRKVYTLPPSCPGCYAATPCQLLDATLRMRLSSASPVSSWMSSFFSFILTSNKFYSTQQKLSKFNSTFQTGFVRSACRAASKLMIKSLPRMSVCFISWQYHKCRAIRNIKLNNAADSNQLSMVGDLRAGLEKWIN